MVVRTQRPVHRRRRRDRGAAAVEFALVSPLLLGMLFGVIDYGLYFADVVTVQQGVGDAARAATIAPLAPRARRSGGRPPAAVSAGLERGRRDPAAPLACSVAGSVQPLTGVLT